MRYADNLAQGHGLVFNIGEKIEGFTNPLMVFIMAGSILAFGENYGALAIQILGLICLIANIYLVLKILNRLLEEKKTDFLLFIGALLTMGWYPVMYWSVFGMETGFLTTLVLYTIFLSLYKDTPRKINLLLAVVLALIYLARPEGALYIAVFYTFRFLRNLYAKTGWARVIAEALITIIPAVAYQVFRVHYYHATVPNTYILKTVGMPFLDKIKNGVGFYEPFLSRVELLLATITLFFFVYIFEANLHLKEKLKELIVGKFRYVTLFTVSFIIYGAYQVSVGGDAWPPAWRMFAPYTVLMFLAFVVTSQKLKESFNLRNDLFLAFTSLTVTSLLIFMPYDYHYDFMRLEPYPTRNNAENLNSALAINELTTKDATLVSFAAGTIPYITERYSIDPLGKMDSYIAHLPPDLSGTLSSPRGMYSIPGHNKYDLNYSFKEKRPDVIVYLAFYGHVCTWAKETVEDWCNQNYDLVEYKGVKVLLRKDSQNILWAKLGATASSTKPRIIVD